MKRLILFTVFLLSFTNTYSQIDAGQVNAFVGLTLINPRTDAPFDIGKDRFGTYSWEVGAELRTGVFFLSGGYGQAKFNQTDSETYTGNYTFIPATAGFDFHPDWLFIGDIGLRLKLAGEVVFSRSAITTTLLPDKLLINNGVSYGGKVGIGVNFDIIEVRGWYGILHHTNDQFFDGYKGGLTNDYHHFFTLHVALRLASW